MTERKVAIVTGATGYVGSNLVRALLGAGWKVTCIVRPESAVAKHDWHRGVRLLVYDGRWESLTKVKVSDFGGGEIVVFHLAAMAGHQCPPDRVGDMVASNIVFGTHLLEAMPLWGATRLINTGTFWQYDRAGQYEPMCLYAATKEAFEAVVAFYVRRERMRCTTLMLFDVYGPRDPRGKIIPFLNEHARTGARLGLSPGMQKMDLVYIADVVAAFMIAANRLLRGGGGHRALERFAVSSGTRLTLREVVATYEQVMAVTLNLAWGEKDYREREIMEPWQPAAGDRLEGWQPQFSLHDGLAAIRQSMA